MYRGLWKNISDELIYFEVEEHGIGNIKSYPNDLYEHISAEISTAK